METPHRHLLLLPQSALDDLLATAELEALEAADTLPHWAALAEQRPC